MKPQNFEQAKQYAINRLQQELAAHLYYHGFPHTRDEVVPAAQELARREGVTGESLELLLTAAWFHDIGYVEQAVHHELIGARIAGQVLPSFGYNEDQVETVRGAIMATALPQSPTSLIEQIMADADLYVLGGDNFMPRNGDLRRELSFMGKEFTDEQWYTGQLRFVEGHTYFTAAAHSLKDSQKKANIAGLKGLLEELRQRG